MPKSKFRIVRAEMIVQRKRIHQLMAEDSTLVRSDALRIAREEIEGGTLTFEIDKEYNRLTEQMERDHG